MPKKIAVIVGAGASNDVIPESQRGNAVDHSNYQPPKTNQLFHLPRELEQYLKLYPKAYTAIGMLRGKIEQNKKSLETLLRELKESPEESKQQQFKQIPLYLQHLFGQISQYYCDMPINYATLISETQRASIAEIAYITLNYDLLFEKALTVESGIVFDKISDYAPQNKKWTFTKLHGSVNWGRKIKQASIRNPGTHLNALLDNLSTLNLTTDLEDDIVVDYSYKERPGSSQPYYPVLTVPVDNKYEFNSPPDHIEKLKRFLSQCDNFLIIGVSGKDRDLLDLLKNNTTNVRLVTVVGGSNIQTTGERFKEGVPQFRTAGWRHYNGGFTGYINTDGIEASLET